MRSKLAISALVVASLFGATAIASAQTQPDERAKLVVIGRYQLRLQCVKRVAARAVMRFPIFGAHKSLHFVRECQHPEQIALLFCSQSQDQSGGDEAFQRSAGSSSRI